MPGHDQLIYRQHVDVIMHGTEADGKRMQQEIQHLVETQLNPELESMFERLSQQGRSFRIDQMTVEISLHAGQGQWQANLSRQICKEIESKLEAMQSFPSADLLSERTPPAKEKSANTKGDLLDTFLFFLQHGFLPWYAPKMNWEEMEDSLLSIMRKDSSRLNQLWSDPVILRSMSLQCSVDFLSAVATIRNPDWKLINQKIPALQPWLRMNTADQSTQLLFWQFYFGQDQETLNFLSGLSATEDLSAIESWLNQQITNEHTNNAQASSKEFKKEDTWFLEDAGLVLIAPFLPAFLKELGLADEKQLLDPLHALQIIQYLARFETHVPGYRLLLPKVLCDIPFHQPVPQDVLLQENELEESKKLLRSVIRHWQALGNSSPEGLQEAFLQRSGKLQQLENGDYSLHMEHKPYDLLLQNLPWSISIIKMPWMQKCLWVHWA